VNKKTILVVENSKYVKELKKFLDEIYNIIISSNSTDIFEIIQKEKIDLVLYDEELANNNEFEICKYTNSIPIIFTTNSISEDVTEKLYDNCAADYVIKPFRKNELLKRIKTNIKLFTKTKKTNNHLKRIAAYSEILSKNYGLSSEDVKILKEVSPLYDIGNIGISKELLNKPSKFTNEEYSIMKQHAKLGYEMLKSSTKQLLRDAAIVAYEHHEKWDGTGYPNGLKGEQIHIFGRIIAVADVFDAIGRNKVYKEALSDEQIIEFFKNESGKHFEPKIVDILLENIDELFKIRDQFNDI